MWGAAAATVAAVAALAWLWSPAASRGVLAGGAWNLASLACLSRLVSAWLRETPSAWRVTGWLLLKFPLLYILAFVVLRAPGMSLGGFGIGFSLVLAVVASWLAVAARRAAAVHPHGR